jgi:hypothetical protein
MKAVLSGQIFQKYSNVNFMKIRPVRAELFHADRQTDGHEEASSQTLFAILRKRPNFGFCVSAKPPETRHRLLRGTLAQSKYVYVYYPLITQSLLSFSHTLPRKFGLHLAVPFLYTVMYT